MSTSFHDDRRSDCDCQALVEVGVRLQKCYGTRYATDYLRSVDIAELTIERVLLTLARRKPAWLTNEVLSAQCLVHDEHYTGS